jgi:hypothetical protein
MTRDHRNIDADMPKKKKSSGRNGESISSMGAHVMGCSETQDMQHAMLGNMADPKRESYLYWEAHECMVATYDL